MSNDLEEEMV